MKSTPDVPARRIFVFTREVLIRRILPRSRAVRPAYAAAASGVKLTPMTFSRRVSAVNAYPLVSAEE